MASSVRYIANEKYDSTYKKSYLPLIVGVFLSAADLIIFSRLGPENPFNTAQFSFVIVIRIVGAIWGARLASSKNRSPFWWGFLGVAAPGLVFFILSLLRKHRTPIQIDTSYPPEVQYAALIKEGRRYMRKKKYREAADVYSYITSNLPHKEEDRSALAWLSNRLA